MKNKVLVLQWAAALLLFLATPGRPAFGAEGSGPLNNEDTKEEAAMPSAENKKVLVAYFSLTGNTREIARQIHEQVGGDIFEIQPVQPYPQDYDAVLSQAREELDPGYRPALKARVADIGAYDVVFIGYPNWFNTFPAPVRTFLAEHDLSGKTVIPFCTHGGGGLGNSVGDIAKLCPRSKVLDGLEVPGSAVKTAGDKVAGWLRELKLIK